jgi:hypothetical protein
MNVEDKLHLVYDAKFASKTIYTASATATATATGTGTDTATALMRYVWH